MKKNEQMKITHERVHANLIQSDCYLRSYVPNVVDLASSKREEVKQRHYYELISKEMEDCAGIRQVLTPVDYPITPESVKSYLPDTNYKLNPDGCLKCGSPGAYRDITAMQDILDSDIEQAISTYSRVVQNLKIQQQQQQQQQKQAQAKNQNEVNANG